MASLSALLAGFRARPDPCLELAAATHLTTLRCAALLPGSSSRQRRGSRASMRWALEELCFKACPGALLGAMGTVNSDALPFTLRADPSLTRQALLLGNVLSSWPHNHQTRRGCLAYWRSWSGCGVGCGHWMLWIRQEPWRVRC